MAELAFEEILRTLARHRVRFLVIGAVAAIAQGSPLPTDDVDIAPARDLDNLDLLAGALAELQARLRVEGQPEGVPFPFDAESLGGNEVWNLQTTYGDLDVIFVPAGTGGYDDLRRAAIVVDFGHSQISMASLADVIRSKQASGREKDLAQLPALRRALEVIHQRERDQ